VFHNKLLVFILNDCFGDVPFLTFDNFSDVVKLSHYNVDVDKGLDSYGDYPSFSLFIFSFGVNILQYEDDIYFIGADIFINFSKQ